MARNGRERRDLQERNVAHPSATPRDKRRGAAHDRDSRRATDLQRETHNYQSRNSLRRQRSSRNSSSSHRESRYSAHNVREDTSLQQLQQRNRRLLFLAAIVLSAITWNNLSHEANVQPQQMKKVTRIGNSFVNLDTDRSAISNNSKQLSKQNQPPMRQETYTKQQSKIKEDIKAILAEERTARKRWNPCTTKYELERHDHEPRHGDICRLKGGIMSYFECPQGCHETAGNPPYCAQDATSLIGGSKPCRARDPNAEPRHRCDDVGVCILAVGSPKGQFKGKGVYHDDSCDGMCGSRGNDASFTKNATRTAGCRDDFDCSLAGICLPETNTCLCDAWADGPDCSYLKFQPVDKSRLGYMNERHSSWGGSIVYSPDDEMYHMYVSEVLCKVDTENRKRCGLSAWETHSRIVVAKSTNIDGPYYRNGTDDEVILPPEHHNPSIHVSPNGEWHLFTISGSAGPIERMVSIDFGKTWSQPTVISPRQNPGPLLRPDGSTYLYYRADGMDLPSPTCSDEGIAMQICPVAESCHPPNDIPLFGHTGEDPSVFVDHRGNYHMLFNALPYKCVPKFNQGGHAWSKDGINWSSNPRVGAFDTTIQFTDGTSIKCERRERPQVVLSADGKPMALVTGLTGCPKGLLMPGNEEGKNNDNVLLYKGGDDSFTLVQLMAK